jgi:hypothetical protein
LLRINCAAINDKREDGRGNSLSENFRDSFALWKKALLAIAVTIAFAYFAWPTIKGSPGKLTKPEQFNAEQDDKVLTARQFPSIDLPKSGAVIQVGIYSQLSGAEEKQTLLTTLGLNAHIQKRETEQGIYYSVLFGPLPPEAHDSIIATLTSNNLTFFHRPSRGS